MDQLLEILGVTERNPEVRDYDDLTPEEKETYRKMADIRQSGEITLEDFKRHVHKMRQSVEYELARLPEGDPKNTLFKARLLNYILFETFFDRPQQTKEMLEQYGKPKI